MYQNSCIIIGIKQVQRIRGWVNKIMPLNTFWKVKMGKRAVSYLKSLEAIGP